MGVLHATRLLQAAAVEWGQWAGALGNVGVGFGGFNAALTQQVPNDAGMGASLHEVGLPIRVTLLSPHMGLR